MIDKQGNLNALGYSNTGVANGLELYLPLEKDIKDYSGKGHTTMAMNAAIKFDKDKQAAFFETAINNWIKVPSLLLEDMYITNKKTPFNMTVMMDINIPTWTGGYCIFCNGEFNAFNAFIMNDARRCNIYLAGVEHLTTPSFPAISINTWSTLVFMIEEVGLNSYKFTIEQDSNTVSVTAPITFTIGGANKSFGIGMDYDGTAESDFFKGYMKNFKVFNRCLTTEERNIERTLRQMDRAVIPKKTIMASDGIMYLPYGASISNFL